MSRRGAAQRDSAAGGAGQPTYSALPDDAFELTIAFYNVGINSSQVRGKRWASTEQKLATDIVNAANLHGLDMLCLSELGELGVGLGQRLPGNSVVAWIRQLLANSAVSPVEIYADGHYATIVLSDVVQVIDYQVVGGFVTTQPGRCFQHFRVRTSERDKTISIVNCHAPTQVDGGHAHEVLRRIPPSMRR